ncbi:MAG: mannose-1-phosphate guanylyltransferase [Bacillota bacterium]
MNIYSVVMAGGGGTRFWPVSRHTRPKQVLNLSGSDVMINDTIRRNSSLIPVENTYIVTNKDQEKVLKQVLFKGVNDNNILLEPVGRNTAACIGLAALVINKRHGESIMCIFPSDAYISKNHEYLSVLELACNHSRESDYFITLGIKPSYPATGYGYIKHSKSNYSYGIYHVEEFVEKPDPQRAVTYIQDGNYLWNSGILVCRTDTVLKAIEELLPYLYKDLMKLEQYIDTDKQDVMLEEIYPKMQSISIDYGVLEKSSRVLVIPSDIGWSDVGSWDAIGTLISPTREGNIVRADHIGIDTKDTIVYGDKLIATIGVSDLIIVNTEDALLVCHKSRAQDVKGIVDQLKAKNRTDYI